MAQKSVSVPLELNADSFIWTRTLIITTVGVSRAEIEILKGMPAV